MTTTNEPIDLSKRRITRGEPGLLATTPRRFAIGQIWQPPGNTEREKILAFCRSFWVASCTQSVEHPRPLLALEVPSRLGDSDSLCAWGSYHGRTTRDGRWVPRVTRPADMLRAGWRCVAEPIPDEHPAMLLQTDPNALPWAERLQRLCEHARAHR